MNGVHDMGGMHGFGPVQPEADEPVFHAPGRAACSRCVRAVGAWRRWNIDAGRHSIETLPPADYLRLSYYEKWFAVDDQADARRRARHAARAGDRPSRSGRPVATPPLTADKVLPAIAAGGPDPARDVRRDRASRRVRRFARATSIRSAIRACRATSAAAAARSSAITARTCFPTPTRSFEGEKPQLLYTVRFAARELWGEAANPADTVYLDLWEDYLDAV